MTTALVNVNKNIAGLGKNATKETMIKAFTDTALTLKKNGWNVAVTIYKTLNHERFKEIFENVQTYAEAIGYKKDYVYKQSKAVDVYGLLVNIDEAYVNVSVGFVVEFLSIAKKIDADVLEDFIHTESITAEMSREDIRASAKHYKSIINGASGTGAKIDEGVDNENEGDENEKSGKLIVNEKTCVITDYELGSVVVVNENLRNELKQLLEKYGLL